MDSEVLMGVTVAVLVFVSAYLFVRVQRLEDEVAGMAARHDLVLDILRDNLKPRGSVPPRPIPHQEQEFRG